jgi:glycosyltransferase involved in cell wall biosynthesis
MTNAIQVSVVIPAYNAEKYLERSISSLVTTQYSPLELIVIDDGSTDGTFELAKRLTCRNGQRLLVAQHPLGRNCGVSASRNLGIQLSSGELVSFLDADDTVEPWRFDHAASILSQQPDVDAVYETASVIVEDSSQSSDWVDEAKFGLSTAAQGINLLKSLIHGIPWHTSAITVRRSLLERTGGFNKRLSIAEDCELWMRMVVAGTVVPGDLSRSVSHYRRHSGSLFSLSLDRKLDYLVALSSFMQWLRLAEVDKSWRRLVEDEFALWLDNAFVQSRCNQRRDIAFKLATLAARGFPKATFSRRTLAHLIYAVIGR